MNHNPATIPPDVRSIVHHEPANESSVHAKDDTLDIGENEFLRSYLRLAEHLAPEAYNFGIRKDDDNGDIPIRFINRTKFSVVALGIIFTPEHTRYDTHFRMIGIATGCSRNVNAKLGEDFVFLECPWHYQDNQPVGFYTAHTYKLEYYLEADTASEITVCNKFAGLRTLKDICSDTILNRAGSSPSALNQLELPGSLLDYLFHRTDNTTFDRAKNLLDAWLSVE